MFKLDVFELDIKTPIMIKANDKDTRVTSNEVKLGHVCICKILFKSNTKDQKKHKSVALVSLMLTLNRFSSDIGR